MMELYYQSSVVTIVTRSYYYSVIRHYESIK